MCCGVYFDMRPEPVVAYPYTTASVSCGDVIEEIAWREVPTGVLPAWTTPVAGVAKTDIAANTPLLPSLIAESSIPPGWWAVSLPLPQRAAPGTPVRVALDEQYADGVVAGALIDSGYEISGPVAFPPDQADRVAAITADHTPVVMIGSP